MPIPPVWICTFVTLIALWVLLQPTVRYLMTGWWAKRKDIMDALSPKARLNYYRMFGGGKKCPQNPDEASIDFERFYTQWYGRRYFLVPSILLALAGLTAISAVVFSILGPGLLGANRLFQLPLIASASLGGAYLWVVNDHIGRARRLDFSPANVMWGVLRFVIAVPMGYGLSALVKDDVAPFVAFGLAAFPLIALTTLIRRLTEKALISAATPDETSDELIKLQGINKTILERLSDEDVTTIPQIAYCDPVRLTMRSNLSFNFIIDCMSQALAWMYLAQLLDTIRPFGIRGAFEIKCLIDDLEVEGDAPEDLEARNTAKARMQQISQALKVPPDLMQNAFEQIAGDPYTIFLYVIWENPELLEDDSDEE